MLLESLELAGVVGEGVGAVRAFRFDLSVCLRLFVVSTVCCVSESRTGPRPGFGRGVFDSRTPPLSENQTGVVRFSDRGGGLVVPGFLNTMWYVFASCPPCGSSFRCLPITPNATKRSRARTTVDFARPVPWSRRRPSRVTMPWQI